MDSRFGSIAAGCFRRHLSDPVDVLKCMLAFEKFPIVSVLLNRWMKGYGHEEYCESRGSHRVDGYSGSYVMIPNRASR